MYRSYCEVHGQPLQEEVVPIEAISVYRTPDHGLIEARHFPHAETTAVGVGTEKVVSFCPECRRAEALWNQMPGDWRKKRQEMDRGYDPLRGGYDPLRKHWWQFWR